MGRGVVVHYVQDKHDVTEDEENGKLHHAKLKAPASVIKTLEMKHTQYNIYHRRDSKNTDVAASNVTLNIFL